MLLDEIKNKQYKKLLYSKNTVVFLHNFPNTHVIFLTLYYCPAS